MNDFYELSAEYGTDKVLHHGYHFYYPRHLERLRGEEFNMLEIGYQAGHSCRMWEKYFPKANIFAMDIGVEGNFDNHTVFRGDQSKQEDLMNVVREMGSAKFILDDGSHIPVHQIETFNFLFENLLVPGGIYIIEDVECNYWDKDCSNYGYKIGFYNFIDYTKKFVDYINSEFSGKKNKLKISSITYGQNCIIIEKQTEEETSYFERSYRYGMFL